jgi:flavin reductase (DIM6/NTAB) family NADH-FMN oxidoreductase RutF
MTLRSAGGQDAAGGARNDSVPLGKALRLLNHGPTTLVSAAHGDRSNVMAAAWVMPLDFEPPKVLAVIAAGTFTRGLIEASGEFALNLPTVAMLEATMAVGSASGRDVPDKFARFGLKPFPAEKIGAPLVEGCVGWLECRVIREERNEREYDLFIAEVVAARADTRVFADGRWDFDKAPDSLRTIHHIAGGNFFATGRVVSASG